MRSACRMIFGMDDDIWMENIAPRDTDTKKS